MQPARSIRIYLAALFCLLWCAAPASAASLDQLTPYLTGHYFTWSEFSQGRRLLKETGPLFAGGLLFGLRFPSEAPPSVLVLTGKVELFGGFTRYDGETQAPDRLPVKTDVSYLGSRQDLDLGYRLVRGNLDLEPFSGVGYRWWLRDLYNATSSTGSAVSGYTEFWQTVSLRMGGRARYRGTSGSSFFAEAGGKYPVFTANSVDNSAVSATFRPIGQWSAFAEAGVTYHRLRVGLSYEGFRFSASPLVSDGSRLFFQPDSSADLFGLNVGWSF